MGCCQSSYPYTSEFWKADIASALGNVAPVKKYLKKNKSSFLINWLFVTAVENNQKNVLECLLKNGVYQEYYSDFSIRYLTLQGHTKREKIFDISRVKKESVNRYKYADVLIEQNYDSEVVKLLLTSANYNCHSYNDLLFRMACGKKDVEIINLIFTLNQAPKNIFIFCDIFHSMCCEGNIEIVKIILAQKGTKYFNLHFALELAVKHKQEEMALYLLQQKARFGKLNKFFPKYKAFINKLQKKRQRDAVNIIYNWWIPICYDMNRPCGKRMFERNYQNYQESFV